MNEIHLAARRILGSITLAFHAFTTGARIIPLGDNGPLLRALADKSRQAGGDRPGHSASRLHTAS
jgi:hypothetical protein